MAKEIIDTTTQYSGRTGDPARVGFEKINRMFSELYGKGWVGAADANIAKQALGLDKALIVDGSGNASIDGILAAKKAVASYRGSSVYAPSSSLSFIWKPSNYDSYFARAILMSQSYAGQTAAYGEYIIRGSNGNYVVDTVTAITSVSINVTWDAANRQFTITATNTSNSQSRTVFMNVTGVI